MLEEQTQILNGLHSGGNGNGNGDGAAKSPDARLGSHPSSPIHVGLAALEGAPSEKEERRSERDVRSLLSPSAREGVLSGLSHGIEALLTTKEASQILKIHPKVLERMAKRGEVPALKVGKFWRYRATALDAWINTRLQSKGQVCRIATSF